MTVQGHRISGMDQPTPLPVRSAWVRKPDGQLVPFEADKISRDLFAASETLGKPDAFLARETDGQHLALS